MENKLLELFEKQDTVSMNDDIFPLVEEEFAGQVMVMKFMNLHTST